MGVKKVDSVLQSPALDELVTMSKANGRYNWTLEIKKEIKEEGF